MSRMQASAERKSGSTDPSRTVAESMLGKQRHGIRLFGPAVIA